MKKAEEWPERRVKSRGSIVKGKRKFHKADVLLLIGHDYVTVTKCQQHSIRSVY